MAVTIHTSPQDYTPSGNPLTFVFSSDQTGQTNFSYKVEIYVDAALVETNKIFPELGIKAHFDCSGVAERYCNTIDADTGASTEYDSANYVSLECKVIENYGTPPIDVNNASSTINTYKGKVSKANFLVLNTSNYIYAAAKLWLTLFPRTIRKYVNLSYFNYFTFITDSNTLRLILMA